ncbi:hypothetical protein ACJMK2_013947 [Sinanodonta woodiana]|uniref:DNA helicase Pif1-like 2B domain-containing protein n=1 Tax=Sinanodonta woodiana TaxID=1069815 RepID=A0ABD3UZ38_SINWO
MSKLFFFYPGEVKVYHSEDEGDKAALLSCRAMKHLYLKVGAPLILNVNLSDELVNGLRGIIVEMHKDSATDKQECARHADTSDDTGDVEEKDIEIDSDDVADVINTMDILEGTFKQTSERPAMNIDELLDMITYKVPHTQEQNDLNTGIYGIKANKHVSEYFARNIYFKLKSLLLFSEGNIRNKTLTLFYAAVIQFMLQSQN